MLTIWQIADSESDAINQSLDGGGYGSLEDANQSMRWRNTAAINMPVKHCVYRVELTASACESEGAGAGASELSLSINKHVPA